MAIDWSHLPTDVKTKVCFCPSAQGWSLDPATGYWVHSCGKPSIKVAILQCDVCKKVFVPKCYKKVKWQGIGVACDDCEPPGDCTS